MCRVLTRSTRPARFTASAAQTPAAIPPCHHGVKSKMTKLPVFRSLSPSCQKHHDRRSASRRLRRQSRLRRGPRSAPAEESVQPQQQHLHQKSVCDHPGFRISCRHDVRVSNEVDCALASRAIRQSDQIGVRTATLPSPDHVHSLVPLLVVWCKSGKVCIRVQMTEPISCGALESRRVQRVKGLTYPLRQP